MKSSNPAIHVSPVAVNRNRGGPDVKSLRKDRWWLKPAGIASALVAFVVYGTWAAIQGTNYHTGPYLSPFYSPCLSADCTYAALPIVGNWWKLSPALLVVPFPLGFRMSCYYFRRAYYRSFWLSPPACGVAEPHSRYSGESRLPLLMQNLHRYFFYSAVILGVIDTWDAVMAFDFGGHIGIGLGSLVMAADAALLWAYILGCHSCRHLLGGRLNLLSRHRARLRAWRITSAFNRHHGTFGWLSLFWVAFTDLYIRLAASGTIVDPRIFH